ncbi:23661_t:CDS:2, partial [Gigaspora margarita]
MCPDNQLERLHPPRCALPATRGLSICHVIVPGPEHILALEPTQAFELIPN